MPNLIDNGCYVIRYEPAEPSPDVLFFEGTARFMRVKAPAPDAEQLRAGADLYCRLGCQCDPDLPQKRREEWSKWDPTRWKKEPDEDGKSIPIFPRKLYRYYLQITKILENVPEENISLSISVHEFKQDREWPNPGSRWVCLKKVPAAEYKEHFEGNVLDQDSGQMVGKLTMCRVSKCLRRATVVIHRVQGIDYFPGYTKAPKEGTQEQVQKDVKQNEDLRRKQAEDAWKEAFKEAGWEIVLNPKPKPDLQPVADKEKPVDAKQGKWTIGELQQAIYEIRLQQIIENAGFDLKPPFADKSLKKMDVNEILQCIEQTFNYLQEEPAPKLKKYVQAIIENLQTICHVNAPAKPLEKMEPAEIEKYLEDIQTAIAKSAEEVQPCFQTAVAQSLAKMTPREIKDFLEKYLPDLSTLPDPLDKEWVYQLLCVPRIDGFDRGVMFDTYGSDSENLPLEGAAVAAEWAFGDDAKQLIEDDPRKNRTKQTDQRSEGLKELVDQIEFKWGQALNQALENVPAAYFRVGVHEIGHTMGLDHNFKDDGFMNTTDSIADDNLEKLNQKIDAALQAIQLSQLQRGVPPHPQLLKAVPQLNQRKSSQSFNAFVKGTLTKTLQKAVGKRLSDLVDAAQQLQKVQPFPYEIKKHFQADDLDRLRFGPDVTTRPGTRFSDFGPLYDDPAPTPAEGLKLDAAPLLDAVPFGAPARIKVKITNTTSQPQNAPISLSLKTSVVTGSVTDPNGNERTFWPIKKCEDSDPGGVLAPFETRTYTMTLLRGAQKALFPLVGHHRVKVTATWLRNGNPVFLESQTTVRVTAPVDDNHLATALKVLSTPDTLLSVAIIGDHLIEGNLAVKAAVDNPILSPHFAIIRAKLLLTGPTELDLPGACGLINDKVVMSFDEIASISQLLSKRYQGRKPVELKTAVGYLKTKLAALCAEGSIEVFPANILKQQLDGLI